MVNMKAELPIDYATLKKQLQLVTEDLEDWKEQYKELEKELRRYPVLTSRTQR